mgnify:FL=1
MSQTITFISVKSVIAKTFRDYNLKSNDHFSYAIEWSGEALDMIGQAPILVDKNRILEVTSHKVKLPFDLQQIDVIYYPGEEITKKEEINGKENFCYLLRYLGSDFNTHSHQQHKYSPNKTTPNYYSGYTLNDNYINTDFEQGFILVYYKGYPVDNEGFPVIPDSTRVKNAIVEYIIWKLISRGWKHPAGVNFLQQKQLWEEACARARANLMMPDVEDYRKFDEDWVHLIPDTGRYDHEYNQDHNTFSIEEISDIGFPNQVN